jgi:hypothetical protein
MNKFIFNTILLLQVALLSSSAIASKRERDDDLSDENKRSLAKLAYDSEEDMGEPLLSMSFESALKTCHEGYPTDAKLDDDVVMQDAPAVAAYPELAFPPDPVFTLQRGPRQIICRYLDGVTALNLLYVSNSFYRFFHEAVYLRGHIKIRHLDFELLTTFDTDDQQDHYGRNAYSMVEFFKPFLMKKFKKFLKMQQNLRSVDLSKVDSYKNEALQTLVAGNSKIERIVVHDGFCVEEDNDYEVTRETMAAVGAGCRSLKSLVFHRSCGDFVIPLLLAKPADQFNDVEHLVFKACYNGLENLEGEVPRVGFFRHIICAFPKLRSLEVLDTPVFELDEFDGVTVSPLQHLALTYRNDLTGRRLAALTRCCPQLETISFTGSEVITLAEVVQLAHGLPRLREIVLPDLSPVTGNRYTNGHLKFVIRDGRYTFVNTSNKGAKHLPIGFYHDLSEAGLDIMQDLDLTNTRLTDEELLELPGLFPYVRTLTVPKDMVLKPIYVDMTSQFTRLKSVKYK